MKPGKRTIIIFSLILLVGAVAWWGTEWFVEDRINRYLNENLPDTVHRGTVDVDFFPGRVQVNKPTIQSDNETVASARSIEIKPRMWSLFGDTIRVEEIILDDVTVTIRKTAEGYNVDHSLNELIDSFSGGTGETRSAVIIDRLAILNGRLRYFDENQLEPSIQLFPLHAVVGPLDFSKTQTDFNLTMVMKPDQDRPPVKLTGNLTPYDPDVPFTGALNMNGFNLVRLNPYLPRRLSLEGGAVSGELPLAIGWSSLKTKPASLNVDGLRLRHRDVEPLDKSSDTDTTEPAGEYLSIGRTDVSFSNTSIALGGETTARFQSTTGFLELFPSPDRERSYDIKGGFELSSPTGNLLYDLQLSLDPPYNTSVLAHLSSPRVRDFNPLLLREAPFEFTRGSGESAVEGTVSKEKLALQVGVKFKDLKLQTKKNASSGFLNIPVPVLARYLSKQDGELEISFKINGTPENPTLDISSIRQKILVNLGIDAAVLSTLGLPIYVGDKAVEKITGVSVVGSVGKQLGKIFKSDDPIGRRAKPDTGTAVSSPTKEKKR